MKATVDAVGRVVAPKPLRDALGLRAGSTVDISRYGAGLQLVPTGRTARLVDEDGVLVASGDGTVDDDAVLAAAEHGAELATRDLRAKATYETVGARVVIAA